MSMRVVRYGYQSLQRRLTMRDCHFRIGGSLFLPQATLKLGTKAPQQGCVAICSRACNLSYAPGSPICNATSWIGAIHRTEAAPLAVQVADCTEKC